MFKRRRHSLMESPTGSCKAKIFTNPASFDNPTFIGPDGRTYGKRPVVEERPFSCVGHNLILSETGVCVDCVNYGGPWSISKYAPNSDVDKLRGEGHGT